MNRKQALRQRALALNVIDLVHCLHTGEANEISQAEWKAQFASDKNYEAARKQWQRWRADAARLGLGENREEGRETRFVIFSHAADVAEKLRAEAQAVLDSAATKRTYPDVVTIRGRTYRLKVYGRTIRPLTDQEYDSLRESIREKGRIESPVLTDPDGNVVDGKHRLMIADELGLSDVPIVVISNYTREDLQRLAVDLNACRRHLTKQERAQLRRQREERTEARRASKKSLREIAKAEGVSLRTAQRDLAGKDAPPTPIEGQDGRTYPSRKANEEEIARRRARVAELVAADRSRRDIAEELGVSLGTVQNDVNALGAASAELTEADATYGIVAHAITAVAIGDLEVATAPLETCLQTLLDELQSIVSRVEDEGLKSELAAAEALVSELLWRLLESPGASAA